MKRHDHRAQKTSQNSSPEAASRHEHWGAGLTVPRDPHTETLPKDDDGRSKSREYSGYSLVQLYLEEASETPLLSLEEEHRLGVLNMEGDEDARQRLIKSNLLLVVSLAKEFSGFGLELSDLIALGNVGLMRAVDRFDPDRGAKFSTYASWWIKQSIRRGLTNDAATVRVPAHVHQKARDLIKAERELATKLHREPTIQELSQRVGLTEEQIKYRLQSRQARNTVPLDAPLSGDSSDRGGTSLSDTLADPNVVATSEVMVQDERYMVVRAILGDTKAQSAFSDELRPLLDFYRGKFKEREIDILNKRFGIGGANGRIKTLEEIGVEYRLTRERIRQLEARALNKFRRAFEHIDRERDRDVEALVAASRQTSTGSR